MRYFGFIALSLALILSACDSGEDPGTRPGTGGTGGLTSTGGAGGGSTGGSSATGGAGTGGAVGTGGIVGTGGSVGTGGAVAATGGSSTGGAGTGGAGTGGSAVVPMCTDPIPSSKNSFAPCTKTKANDWLRQRFTSTGRLCVVCTDLSVSPSHQVTGCSVSVGDDRSTSGSAPQVTNTLCVDSCGACPVERCFSTGSDWGTEYPCS